MSQDQIELVGFVKAMNADLGQLDILVEDVKCQQANVINGKGIEKQVEYLLKHYSPVGLRNLIRHEMKFLNARQMSTQSKVHPAKNQRWRKWRKK